MILFIEQNCWHYWLWTWLNLLQSPLKSFYRIWCDKSVIWDAHPNTHVCFNVAHAANVVRRLLFINLYLHYLYFELLVLLVGNKILNFVQAQKTYQNFTVANWAGRRHLESLPLNYIYEVSLPCWGQEWSLHLLQWKLVSIFSLLVKFKFVA